MLENDFDRLVKSKLSGVREDVDVWSGIESGLARRRRMRVVRNVSFISVAAAACLTAGMFIFKDNDKAVGTNAPEVPVQIAENVQEEVTPQSVEIVPDAVAVVRTAVRRAEPSQKVAEVATDDVKPVSEQIADLGLSEEAVAQAKVPENKQDNQNESISVNSGAATVGDDAGDVAAARDYWSRSDGSFQEESSNSRRNTRHTSLAILGNITSVASDNSFIAKASPMHSSSQSGKNASSSSFEPASDPYFFMPVSGGLQVKVELFKNFSVGGGLNYTYLVSRYDLLVDKERFTGAYSQLHYIGVPLFISYNFVNTEHLGVYVTGGGMVDKCIASRYVYGSHVTTDAAVKGVQFSVDLGVGIEYYFYKGLGVYFDPAFVYYFDNQQPLSIRTVQPIQIRFEAGFRYRFK